MTDTSAPTTTASPDPSDAQPPLLRLDDVWKSYGALEVLRGARLEVPRGRIVWLGGSNGVGKTTLLRIACGLIDADRGEVSLDGLHPQRDRRAYQLALGFLPAGNSGLVARLSVRHNLEFWARAAFVPRTERGEAIERAAAAFGLTDLLKRRVDRLSMGQRQRVRLAMVFLHRPTLVMLDEPHTSLDGDGLELVSRAIEDVIERGGSGIWCSPSLDRDRLRVDDGYELRDGALVAA